MRRTIQLRGISRLSQDDTVQLQFHFQDSAQEQESILFFTFPCSCEKALVTDISDAFLLALYPICARKDMDLTSDIPASKEFYRKLQALNTFLGHHSQVLHAIHISAETTEFERKGEQEWRLASGSLGVDCLHTLYCAEHNPLYPRPTHLVFNNTGSNEEGGKQQKELLQGRIANTQAFCKEYGYQFLFVDSNYKSLFGVRYVHTQLYINSAIAFMLGHEVSVYYVSSAGHLFQTLDFNHAPGHIDFLLYPFLNTHSLDFCTIEGDWTSRFYKTKDLVSYPPAQKYLNVCFDHAQNCCICEKCRRTLITLEALDAVDGFAPCFSLKTYADNKDHIFADFLLDYQKGDDYALEIIPFLKKKLTRKHHLLAWYKRTYLAIRHLRGGVALTKLLHLKCW
ncbi:MAG: hypothetical protein IJJ26_12285 [Victivallales bacterium]|nr:hypothetical protein [Victivallales bacterium]